MSRLDKHKAAHKAAMSRKKVQSNPLEEIMRPPEAMSNDEIDQMGANAPMMGSAPKRPQNSPAVRDERMRRKGRFPDMTIGGMSYLNGSWEVWIMAPSPGMKRFGAKGPGIHGCIESLWDQYCRWRDEQEAAK